MLARMSLLTTRRPLSPRAGRASSSSSISSLFRPWPQSVVTSHGDYRDEAWLEKHIGGPLYEHQQSLPRLPIPEIHETMARLASTALPLAKTPEEATQLQRALEIFPQQAAHLQKRLLERKQEMDATDSSWLQLWWNTLGYLQVRDSSMINVSYFFHFADDPHAHSDIQRGAALLQAAMRVRKQVASGQMPADCIGRPPKQTPLCSVAYKYMFHATRIPQLQQDTYELHDPSLHNHVVVSCRGQFYKLTVCDPQTGEPYSLATLEAGLEQIKQYAATNTHNNNTTGSMELGWLTSMNRDDWAKARQTLLNKGGSRMQEALTTLESGALLLCLDDQEAPVSRAEVAKLHLWGGGATMEAGANRWFDKSVQLMVSQNAKAGFMGEHSMMDGMPCVGLADALTKMTYDKCLAMETSSGTTTACVVEPIFDQALAAIGQDTVAPLVNKGKCYTILT
jgi:carnitine O-acetyltransferase